jgi:ADP-ribose pyrophosphatase YjhB (NUDIX family)
VRPDFYYLETDGQVFLVKRGKEWTFPSRVKQLPCRFEPDFIIPLPEGDVLYAHPKLEVHPDHWFHKDEIIGRRDVASLVQQAVNRTLPRGAAKVAIIERGNVLMVKAKRGLTKDMWNLPGGFMGYGEHPETGAAREVFEELGVRVKLERLLGIYAERFARTGGYMISFVYLGKRRSKTLRPHPGEIAEVRWMPVREAIRVTKNPFAQAGLRDYLKSQP